MLKICHICPSFNNVIYSQLVEREIENGDEIRVFYYRAKGTELLNGEKKYVDGTTPYRNIDRISFYYKENKILRVYLNIYKKNQFNIIHAHTLFSAGFIAYKVKKRWEIPYIVAVRATDINDFFKKRFYLRKLGINILLNSEAIIFLSEAHKEKVFDIYIPDKYQSVIAKKTYVIPNGIDRFWIDNKSIKQKKLENSKRIRLIYYGDINSNKNVGKSIEACKILIREGYEIEFNIIGKILEKKYLKLLTKEEFIIYKEFMEKENLIEHLRRSDVFIMPSKSETFGLSYVEAMSQGVPIIYSEGQGFDKQFEEGKVGYKVIPKNEYDIVAKIKMILNNYEEVSKNCLANINRFTWDNISKQYQEIYHNILK